MLGAVRFASLLYLTLYKKRCRISITKANKKRLVHSFESLDALQTIYKQIQPFEKIDIFII
jgi:hypothetical protein